MRLSLLASGCAALGGLLDGPAGRHAARHRAEPGQAGAGAHHRYPEGAHAGEPLVKLLEAETGLRVKLSVPTSYAATIEAMGTHNVDVGWLAPLAYVLAHDRVGAEVLVANVRNGSTTSSGQIVVRAESSITSLEALRGKRFAFADNVSVTGHHLPVAFLLARGLDPAVHFADTVFVGGDDRVLMAVYNRQVDAGAIVGESGPDLIAMSALARTSFQPMPPDLGEQLRVIARTDPIPNDVVSVRKGVPPESGQKIRDGLLRVAASPDGAATLRELYGIDGLGPVTDADFAVAPGGCPAARPGPGRRAGTPPTIHRAIGDASAARMCAGPLVKRHHRRGLLPEGTSGLRGFFLTRDVGKIPLESRARVGLRCPGATPHRRGVDWPR